MTKNDIMNEYIQNYPQLHSWLYFNTIILEPYNASFMTDSDNVIEEYVDGSKRKQYTFAISFTKEYDTGTSDINIEAMNETQNFTNWIEEKADNKELPDFGETCYMLDIKVLSPMPIMSIDSDTSVARYMVQAQVEYIEKKGV